MNKDLLFISKEEDKKYKTKLYKCNICGKQFIPNHPLQECCTECSIELCSFEYSLDKQEEDFDTCDIFQL